MPLKAHILQHSNTHRWELPVGNYPSNSGNYHYPLFWVIFMVILHDFIFKNYHENQSDCYPFFRNGKLPDFFYKLPYYIFSDLLSKFIFALRISIKMHRFFFTASFRIEVLIETIVSEFYNSYQQKPKNILNVLEFIIPIFHTY